MDSETRTIPEWEDVYVLDIRGQKCRVKILDPDGFDRSDADLYKRKFTKREFEQGLVRSTCEFSRITDGDDDAISM